MPDEKKYPGDMPGIEGSAIRDLLAQISEIDANRAKPPAVPKIQLAASSGQLVGPHAGRAPQLPAYLTDFHGQEREQRKDAARSKSLLTSIVASTVGVAIVGAGMLVWIYNGQAAAPTPQQSTALKNAPKSKVPTATPAERARPDASQERPAFATADAIANLFSPPQAGSVRLRAPDIVTTGKAAEVPFPIEIDGPAGSAKYLQVVVAGLPASSKLNRGIRGNSGEWKLESSDLADLKLTLPELLSGTQYSVSAKTRDGTEIATLSPTLSVEKPAVAPQPAIAPKSEAAPKEVNVPPPSKADGGKDQIGKDEGGKADWGKGDGEDKARNLFVQGEARLADGDVMGARMFFKKAADAGDAQAAVAMGATYDPNLFASLKVQGMRPDVQLARQWYERAVNLGSKDARDRLDSLGAK